MRRKSFAMAPCTVDEAVDEMNLLGYDFHLFIEMSTRAAGVVYRNGPNGYRVALVAADLAGRLGPFRLPVTVSNQSAPCLTERSAVERLGTLGLPFLFYIDAAQGRASMIYRRDDGDYGIVTPGT